MTKSGPASKMHGHSLQESITLTSPMPEFKLDAIESWEAGKLPPSPSLIDFGKTLTTDQFTDWLEALLQLQTASITQNDFYLTASTTFVGLVGMSGGMIILKKQNQWQVVASHGSQSAPQTTFAPKVLQKVEQERATFYESDCSSDSPSNSEPAQVYVASPIFDSTGTVAGVLYGIRNTTDFSERLGFQKTEALIVQLLAGIISSGLARQNRQEEVDRFRMQLEQFASAKLVSAMSEDPTFLDAHEKKVTVLFGDIRGFTGLAQRVGPEKTFSMIRNLMDQLTGSILDEEGFIIDYAGDGIAAMWNAPADQPDHAELACWAAVNMQKVMDKLSEFWSFVAGESLLAGVGINTGIAHVGNAGSRWRLKYSPLGASVNLASRLEGANKYFETSILISESTREQLFTSFPVRRIGPVVVKGSTQAVQVYQLLTDTQVNTTSKELLANYENALTLFEGGELQSAIQKLEEIIDSHSDPISNRLLEQSQAQLSDSSQTPAIYLHQK